jgi:hypothetical protein
MSNLVWMLVSFFNIIVAYRIAETMHPKGWFEYMLLAFNLIFGIIGLAIATGMVEGKP